MSIRIVPQEQLEKQKTEKVGVVGNTPLLFYPSPKTLYKNRIERLKLLAKDSPFADYLLFCAKIVEAQQQCLQENPLTRDLVQTVRDAADKDLAPLSIANLPLTDEWLDYLHVIIHQLKGYNQPIDDAVTQLENESKATLNTLATNLLTGNFEQINSNKAIFIWSALSLYYSQLANQLPGKAIVDVGEQRQYCPVCHSMPIASNIHLGANVGSRYLHCSLCESEWNVTRVKCTNCEDMSALNYYSLDDERAAIKAECCDTCHSYLKIFNQEKLPHLDIVADDLASLMLDMKIEEAGFAKTGINPFLFADS